MTSIKAQVAGSAGMQGDLWSARARDWADVQEETTRSLYEAALERVRARGKRLLDVGCGAGGFCRLARARGAMVAGLDAASALLAIARERVPDGDFRVGELENLPWADGSFDLVTGFNAFQFAANPVRALREARRVAAPGAPVIVATWGRPAACEAAAYFRALDALLPPPPPAAPGPFALSEPGALEALARDAGLTPDALVDVECTWLYADLETALRGLLSTGPAVRAVRRAGAAQVRRAVTASIAPFRTTQGGYQIENTFRLLVAH